ncbi:MAG: rod-binding protein [Thermodesulfobacteriota bacterium]
MNSIDMVSSGQAMTVGNRLPSSQKTIRSKEGAVSTPSDDPETIRRTCQDMEALFLKQLLQEMRKTVPESGSAGFGGGKKMFSELIDTEFSRKMAEKGFGLAGILESQLMQRFRIENKADE